MGKERLYLQSPSLLHRINSISDSVRLLSADRIRYEEMIALPYFGQIILRFDCLDKSIGLDKLDREETWLCELADSDFLVDFMGSVYSAAGVDLSGLDEKLPILAERYAGENCEDSVHAPFLRNDGRMLLRKAGFDPTTPVWEIQTGEEGILLLTLGEESKPAISVPGCPGLSVGCVSAFACTGLIRAELFAHRNRISLVRTLTD